MVVARRSVKPATPNQRWELNNFTQIQKGMHTFKFGGRIRGVKINDYQPE